MVLPAGVRLEAFHAAALASRVVAVVKFGGRRSPPSIAGKTQSSFGSRKTLLTKPWLERRFRAYVGRRILNVPSDRRDARRVASCDSSGPAAKRGGECRNTDSTTVAVHHPMPSLERGAWAMKAYDGSGGVRLAVTTLRSTASRGAHIVRAAFVGILIGSLGALFSALPASATGGEGLFFRDGQVTPRTVFFDDFYLFSAQADVLAMSATELASLQSMLDRCPSLAFDESVQQLRCRMARLEFLIDYRRSRRIDQLLDAVEFVTTLIEYNVMIQRENEGGLNARLGSINSRLREALELMHNASERTQ